MRPHALKAPFGIRVIFCIQNENWQQNICVHACLVEAGIILKPQIVPEPINDESHIKSPSTKGDWRDRQST